MEKKQTGEMKAEGKESSRLKVQSRKAHERRVGREPKAVCTSERVIRRCPVSLWELFQKSDRQHLDSTGLKQVKFLHVPHVSSVPGPTQGALHTALHTVFLRALWRVSLSPLSGRMNAGPEALSNLAKLAQVASHRESCEPSRRQARGAQAEAHSAMKLSASRRRLSNGTRLV